MHLKFLVLLATKDNNVSSTSGLIVDTITFDKLLMFKLE